MVFFPTLSRECVQYIALGLVFGSFVTYYYDSHDICYITWAQISNACFSDNRFYFDASCSTVSNLSWEIFQGHVTYAYGSSIWFSNLETKSAAYNRDYAGCDFTKPVRGNEKQQFCHVIWAERFSGSGERTLSTLYKRSTLFPRMG